MGAELLGLAQRIFNADSGRGNVRIRRPTNYTGMGNVLKTNIARGVVNALPDHFRAYYCQYGMSLGA